jgi:hypothetical protein
LHMPKKDQVIDNYIALDLEDILYISTIDDGEISVDCMFKNGQALSLNKEVGEIVYEAYKTYQEAKIV